MELKFEKRVIACMEQCLREVQNGEETLEIRLPDGSADIGKILGAWGQPVLRSKEWHSDRLSFSGGMMVRILYQPENGEPPQYLEGWIPHSMSWELPSGTREGQLRIDLRPRSVDARSTSARKVMIRSCLSALAEGWVPREEQLEELTKVPEELQVLKRKYPLRLIREVGEKAFQLNERLQLPASAPKPDRLLCCSLTPRATEKKLVSDKLVFRGEGVLHMLYEAEGGQLHSWDIPAGFSQYAQLDSTYGANAAADLMFCVTALEAELDPEGAVELKCALTCQYLLTDQETVELVEDAYIPGRAVRMEKRKLELPVILDSWPDTVEIQRSLQGQGDIAVDTWIAADHPRQRALGDGVRMEFPGHAQILCSGAGGELSSASGRFEGKLDVKAAPGCALSVEYPDLPDSQIAMGEGTLDMKLQLPVHITAISDQALETVCQILPGDRVDPDRERPSLIVKRVGKAGLWEIAKAAGSTVDAIRKANALTEDPVPGQLLLIPLDA